MNHCYFCGGAMLEQLTTFVYEESGQVWIIRNVPASVCKQCGETEYSQEITHRILSFLQQPPRPMEIIHVPAYDMAMTGTPSG